MKIDILSIKFVYLSRKSTYFTILYLPILNQTLSVTKLWILYNLLTI